MRSLAAAAAALLLAGGCTSYLKAQNRTKSARREAADIALGGVAQLVIGSLITMGSYAWYQHASQDDEPANDKITASHGAVFGLLLGTGLVIGGVADGTIAFYQGMSNDHLFAPDPPPAALPKQLSCGDRATQLPIAPTP